MFADKFERWNGSRTFWVDWFQTLLVYPSPTLWASPVEIQKNHQEIQKKSPSNPKTLLVYPS